MKKEKSGKNFVFPFSLFICIASTSCGVFHSLQTSSNCTAAVEKLAKVPALLLIHILLYFLTLNVPENITTNIYNTSQFRYYYYYYTSSPTKDENKIIYYHEKEKWKKVEVCLIINMEKIRLKFIFISKILFFILVWAFLPIFFHNCAGVWERGTKNYSDDRVFRMYKIKSFSITQGWMNIYVTQGNSLEYFCFSPEIGITQFSICFARIP